MHENVRKVLEKSITKSLQILQPLIAKYTEPYLELRRGEHCQEHRQWHSKWVYRPSLSMVFQEAQSVFDELSTKFIEIFRIYHPEYENLVGFQSFGFFNLLDDPSLILRSVIAELWNRYKTFQLSDEQINTIVQEFADFIDSPTLRFRYMAILFNYKMDRETIHLTNDISIRQLSEKEVSEIHATLVLNTNHISYFSVIHDFVLEGEFDERKIFVNQEQNGEPLVMKVIKSTLDKAILALRTFKSGHIGYNVVRFKPTKFCPSVIPALGFGDLYVPLGNYYLSEHDVQYLQRHSKLIFSSLDTPLEMACTRLADAESRTRPQDRLLDAVVGLEAILLAGLSNEDRRGELKFRFALNYSTLFDTPETRLKAHRIAKHLYDLRSTIAHGSIPKEPCNLGDKKLQLNEAAQEACEVLRFVINFFLKYPEKSAYTKPNFWENGYFGIEPRL